ncbi:MAG: sugar phosphate isomerase/epimerase family protein [Pirellulaceae bacterium]
MKNFNLKDLGFDGVELDSPSSLTTDDVLNAIEKTGLPVHGVVDSIHWNKTLSDSDETVRAEGLKGLETAIRASKEYGGSSVLLVPAVCNQQVTYEDAWSRSIGEIRKILPLAEELEIDILLENVWNNFLTDPEETARYIDELDHDRVGAYYDVGNSVRYASPEKWIDVLGNRIKKLDIKEYDLTKTKDGQDWYAGFKAELLEGSCDWPKVISKMKTIGFSGWCTAEIPGGKRERLELIAANMDKIFAS